MGSHFLDFSGEFSDVNSGGFGFIQGKRGDGVEIELFQQGAVGAAGEEIIDGALLAVIKGAVDVAQKRGGYRLGFCGGGDGGRSGGSGSRDF